jgi:hypothetical protein
VDDPGAVGALQHPGELGADLGRPAGRQRPLGLDEVGEGGRLDQLHHDEGVALVVDHVVDGDRARVVEPRGGARPPHHPGLGGAPLGLGQAGR